MSTPLHPAVVHFPLALAAVTPLLAIAIVLVRRREIPRLGWTIVLGLHALAFGSGLVAMRTGERDEDVVERIVAEQAIERHEEAAEQFVWGAGALVALAILPILLRSRPARIAALATIAGGVVVAVLGYRAGAAGGELVYRHGAGAAFATPTGPGIERTEHDDDR